MYYLCYVVSEDGPPTDGPDLATGKGWLAWGDYVLANHAKYPEAAHLAEHAWLPADDLESLESELESLSHAASRDVAAISAGLLAAVRSPPDGTQAVLVTDGTPPSDGPDDEGGPGDE